MRYDIYFLVVVLMFSLTPLVIYSPFFSIVHAINGWRIKIRLPFFFLMQCSLQCNAMHWLASVAF